MRAVALRYGLAPIGVALAALLHLSPVGTVIPVAGLLVLAVLAAAWFGGAGPGFAAALLGALAVPELAPAGYPLLGGFLDLPRFVTFAIEGLVVGWWGYRRRQVDAALRASEQRYELALNASDDGFWDWIPSGDRIYASPRLRAIYGLAPDVTFASRDDLIARIPFHPEDRERLIQAFREHLTGRSERHSIEGRFLHDGQIRWVQLAGFAARDASGAVVRWTGTVRDITERKRAEEALRESERRYALVVNASDEAFWDWKAAGDELYLSPRFLEIFDFPPGTTFDSRSAFYERWPLLPQDREPLMRAIAEHFAGKTQRMESEFRARVRGEIRWMNATGRATRDAEGKVVRWNGAVRDVTARRRAEQALRESEVRFRALTELSADWYWSQDEDLRYTYVSHQAAAAGEEALVGKTCWELAGVTPLSTTWAEHQAVLQARMPFRDLEYCRTTPDGRLEYVSVSGSPVFDLEGEFHGYQGVGRNITERKRAEEALRNSEQRYALAMEAAGDGHTDWDLRTGEHYISPRLLQICGYPPDATFRDRAEWVQRFPFHSEDRPKWERAVAAHFASSESHFKMELRIVVGGEVRWTAFHFLSTRDATGTPIRWTGSVGDITEQKRTEEALRASEERYSLAMEAAEEGYVDSDVDTDQFVTSQRLNEIFGIPRGARFIDRADFLKYFRFYGDDGKKYADTIRGVTTPGGPDRYEFEFRIVLPTGETRWLWTRGKVTRDVGGRARRRVGVVADVTARKLVEEALRTSEDRFARAVAGSYDGVWDIDFVAHSVYFSARTRELCGLPPGPEVVPLDGWFDALPIHPDDRARRFAAVEAHLSGKAPVYEGEFRLLQRDGVYRWRHLHGVCVRDVDGKPLRMAGSISDVDARRRYEDALRESEERYQIAMAASESGYWDWDIPSDRYFVSARANELAGFPRENTFAGRGDFRARIPMHPDDWVKWEAAREELFAGTGERLAMEVRYIVRGQTRWHSLQAMCRRDHAGKVVRWTGSATDVTPRKLAEEALRESEARKSAMFETALDCIISIDEDGRVIEFNPAAERTFGYPRAEAIGKELGDLIVPARLREQHRRGLARYLATGKGRLLGTRVELAAVRADGSEFPVELSVTRIAAEGPPLFTAYLRDVTERKRGEEKLRESEARFRALTELSSDWYWKQDEHLRFTHISNYGAALGGYTDESSLGKAWWELEGLAPLSASWAEQKAVAAARRPFRDLELRRTMPDGSISYHSIGGAPVFDEHGRFRGYQGVGRNITERKRIEEELRSRQEMLGLAQKSAQAIAFEWRIGVDGPEHNRWSPELAAMYGIAPRAYDGSLRQWKDLVHPEDWPAVREALKDAQRTGEVSLEHRVVHGDGSVHWLHARGRMLFDAEGMPVRMVGFMHDVTQRRHAEEALRLSEERHALAVASADEGIFDWDLRSDRAYVSQRAQELFGLPVGELWHPRREWRRILTFHPEDAKLQHDSIKALIAGETSTYDVEFRIILRDGSHRWFRQRAVALRDAAGKAYRMVGSIGDITERKRAEDELQRLERQLRQAQRLEAMGTLAGGIAHDFNNLLGAILGYGEMALRDAPKGSRLARDLDNIIVAGERGRALVDRVLAFSRSAVGERVAVHVERVVREGLDLVSAKLPSNIELLVTLRAGRAAIIGDATQVHQVLMNLATNAVHAMPEGGTLRVSLDASHVDASRVPTLGVLAPASEYLVLRVADTGVGIAPDILERIFDPFFTTKEVGTGTGLGLSLVHGIVSELGGAIDVASTGGVGSTFTVYLPRSGDAVDARADEAPDMPRGGGQRVLIVDDEEPLVRLAARTLEELGYAPVSFTSSTAALAAFRADPQRFDALITDERMPGMSGSALIREVRGIRGTMPIVLMSGYVGGSATHRARSAGAEEVLKKPLSARDLATSLARVLRL